MRVLPALLFASFLACAQEDVSALLERKTLQRIQALDESLDGALGVAAIDLTSGRVAAWHPDTVFPTASAIKVPLMIEVYRLARAGQARLDAPVTVDPKEVVDGSVRLAPLVKKDIRTFTVRELVEAMIEVSDNTATNKLIGLAGIEGVNRALDNLGFNRTRLRRKMMDWAAASRDEENVSTPLEMARIAELLYRGKAVDAAASEEMLATMKRVEADFRRSLPAKVEVAAKPGDLPGVRCEMGVVYLEKRPFALAVMTAYLRDGKNPVPEVASLIFEMFSRLAESNRYGRRL